MFVRERWEGSARCSIDEGGLERGRGGTNELSVSSILDAQSAVRILCVDFYRLQSGP
jgi:hypothetical protein